MPSKDMIHRLRMAHGLTAIMEQLNEPIVERLVTRLSPQLHAGEAMPDLELIRRLIGRLVVTRLQILLDAGEIYDDGLMELGGGDEA